MRYSFLDCALDTGSYRLVRDGQPIHVEPQVFEVLTHLIEHRDTVVTKHQLLDHVWGGRFVGEAALTTRIRGARQAVGDDGTAQRAIRTVHGRGYQFIADVSAVDDDEPPALGIPEGELEQEIRFCTSSDGVRIAYATVGSGPPLVRAAHWLTHLDHDWHSPVWHGWLVDLARRRTLVRYDERGCGLSAHHVEDFSLDAWVRDLEAVVDALTLDRFPLLGVSQGGPVAIAYAARHPERVSHLVLVNTYARGRLARELSPDEEREVELEYELVRLGWGRDDARFRRYFTSSIIPDGSPELWDAFAELLRRSASADNAVQLMSTWRRLDVTDELERLDVPTLVLHSRDELRVPFEQGVALAEAVPGSRLVPLDSSNHLFRSDEPAWSVVLAELDSFLSSDD